MNRSTVVFASLLAAVLVAGCSSSSSSGVPTGQAAGASPPSIHTAEAGGVTVTATWKDPGAGLSFDVKLDNHMIDLDSVTLSGATLANDRGDTLKATRWTASPGGHHREGQLVFDGTAGSFLGRAKWIELTLPPVGSITEPPLRWSLGSSS